MTQAAPKRLLLYAHFDRDGQVDPHVLYQIKALWEYGLAVIFISNSPVSKKDAELLSPFIIDLRLRPDEGYDWGAWKEVLEDLGPEGLKNYDELILMNDSCYGPLFPLAELFDKMAETEADFWGLTESTDRRFPPHIQPYFCLLKGNIIKSNILFDFFANLQGIAIYNDAVFKGEIPFSSFLITKGFKYRSYANVHDMQCIPEIGIEEPTIFSAASTYIRKYRIPFVKRKAFRSDFQQRISHGAELCQEVIESKSSYPLQLIYNHLRRTAPLSWQKNIPGTLNVFPKSSQQPLSTNIKIAVILHLFYKDTIDEALSYLQNMPCAFDLLVSCSKEVASTFEKKFNTASIQVSNLVIKVVENLGRDVLPWLYEFRTIHFDYDLILKLQIKRSSWLDEKLSFKWNRFLLDCALYSTEYVSNIINLFEKEENLGIVFNPTAPIFNMYSPHGYEGCEADRLFRQNWFRRLNITPPEETFSFIHPISIFWYRPQALRSLLTCNIHPDEFPNEPCPDTGTMMHGLERAIAYIAQAQGYYYKLAIPEELLLDSFQLYEDSYLSHYAEDKNCETDPEKILFALCQHWSPLKRKLAPYIAHLPNLFFPQLRAQALFLSNRQAKAKRVWKRIKTYSHGRQIDIVPPQAEPPQPVDTSKTAIRALAYYLPQFHPFPENDRWWGKGFTEWTNVRRAAPLFKSHLQPKIPIGLGYYDLRDTKVMMYQAELAKQFGIFGFCFYYYYFNGVKLMELPLKNLLEHPEIDLPFCFCWANENWTRKWDGLEHEILIQQRYSPNDDINFIKGLLPYFQDKRYIRINGKPMLLIYNVKHIPDIKTTVHRWKEALKQYNEDVYLVLVHFYGPHDPRACDFDAAAQFFPHEFNLSYIPLSAIPGINRKFRGTLINYKETLKLNPPSSVDYTLFRAVGTNFDNTARRKLKAFAFVNSTPQTYETWLDAVCSFTYKTMPEHERYIFLNAWNEWAEGAVLEPDKDWGYGYLNATSRVLSKYTK